LTWCSCGASTAFARSVEQLVTALAEFRSLGIGFCPHQEALDTSTPMGKAMFTIIGAMAELERNVIRERAVAGLDYPRAHGTKSVRSLGAAKLGVGVGTVRRACERKPISRHMGTGAGAPNMTCRSAVV
jgi:DNA invertase Pin-like site-specific DNA recombinase